MDFTTMSVSKKIAIILDAMRPPTLEELEQFNMTDDFSTESYNHQWDINELMDEEFPPFYAWEKMTDPDTLPNELVDEFDDKHEWSEAAEDEDWYDWD